MNQTRVSSDEEDRHLEKKITILVCEDFSPYPGGRFGRHGPNSGEEFRRKFLEPKFANAISENIPLVVNLDGVATYAGSFLEEAFGGLIRDHHYDLETLKLLKLEASGPYVIFKDLALKYIHEAVKREQ